MTHIPCIACRKEVEETLPTCPHCGTLGPKRVMLIPCRNCGETVGKNARRCPYCDKHTPYIKKYLRDHLLIFIGFGVFFIIYNMLAKVVDHSAVYSLLILTATIWLFYKDLKDASGLTNYVPLALQVQKPFLYTSCLKCKKKFLIKTKTCPNCDEPVSLDN